RCLGKAHPGRRECMLSRFFQESDHLLASCARESLMELLDRITRLQMIEQTLDRTRVPVKTGSPPRISGSCDTTLLTTKRIWQGTDRREMDLIPRSLLPSSLYLLSRQSLSSIPGFLGS